ncbi:MAG TPA: Fe(2+)-trafficking protein [Blastocatellia bacterium]|nr:Fe(2+)-trafficking protein [Blastocatellia bacterium]
MSEPQTIDCLRCKQPKAALAKAPFPNALGERILAGTCNDCWQAWLAQQNKLMNHFGLNTMDPDHRQMLIDNLKGFLFNEGPMAQIDTSLEGTITHLSK